MAGLLGNLDLSDPNVAVAAGLLSGRGNLGANLATGLLGGQQSAVANRTFQMNQEAQERANRQNDLATLAGLYKNAMTQDAMQAIQDHRNGVPHVTNPVLGQLQQRMSALAGLPSLSGGGSMPPAPAPAPSAAPPQPSALPPSVASQYSPVVRPQFQAQGPMPTSAPTPQPTPQPPQSQPGAPQSMQDLRDEGDLYALAGYNPIAENRYKLSTPAVSRGVSFDPSTGMPMAGFVDNVPVKFVNGQPQVIPSDIPQAIAGRAGMVAGATAGAKAPYDIHMVTMANGAVVPMSTAQIIGRNGGSTAGPSPFVASGPGIAPQQSPERQPAPPQGPSAPQDFWADMPVIPASKGIGQGTYEAGVAKARADALQRLSESFAQKTDAAQTRLTTNTQGLDLLDRSDTGTGAPLMGDLKTLLVSRFGIPESDFKNDPAATTALNKDLMNAAIAKAKANYQGAGRMTQQEVQNQIKRGAANGGMLKSAIRFLLQADNAGAQYDLQEADTFGEFIGRNGDPLRFPQWYAKKRPLSAAVGAVQLPQNTPANDAAGGYGWSAKKIN